MARTLLKDIPVYGLDFVRASSQRVSYGNILTSLSAISVTLWWKPTLTPTGNADVILGHGNSRWFIIHAGGTTQLRFAKKTAGVETSTGNTTFAPTLNSWYALACRYDPAGGANNASIRVYNSSGVLQESKVNTLTGAMDGTASELTLANDPNRGFYTAMQADDQKIYSRILTDDECDRFARHMAVSRTNLELHAEFDRQNGTQVFCKTGFRSNYVGAFGGTPTYVTGIVPKTRNLAV